MKYFILVMSLLSCGCSTCTIKPLEPASKASLHGTVVVEEGYIYLSDPQTSQGFTFGIDQVSANLTRTFSDRDRVYPLHPQGWKLDLKFWIKDQQRDRLSRVAGPALILSAVDDMGIQLPSRPPQREEKNNFIRGSEERRDLTPRYARAELWPRELPRKISIRGTIPMEVADKTDSVDIILDEEKEFDMGQGMKASLRFMGNGDKAAKFAPAVVTVRSQYTDWPIIRGTYAVGPDGRTRDLNGNFEVAPDGSREWTFHHTIDRSKTNSPPSIRIDRILTVKQVSIKFEFSDVPVGAVR